MSRGKRWVLSPVVAGIVSALLILAMFAKLHQTEVGRRQQEARTTVVQALAHVRSRLEATINAYLHLTKGLTAHVAVHPDISVAEFRAIARQLKHPGVRSIQLAKDSVVSHIYPLRGNAEVIGLDLFELPEQRAAVRRAIARGTVVAGPYHLVQGGVGFVSRTPIYRMTEHPADQGRYWGLATVVIDANRLYEQADIEGLTRHLRFAIRGRDALGADGELFLGDPDVFTAAAVITEVALPNGSWQLAAVPVGGWGVPFQQLWPLWMTGAFIALAAGVLSALLVQRTQTLSAVNGALDAARARAEGAAADRSRFLAAASHDLRQPLHALAIFIGELEGRCRGQPALHELVGKVRRSAEGLGDLFHTLMDISRLDAGAIEPQVRPVPLRPVLERIALENAPAAMRKGLRLRIVASRAAVVSDPVLLECLLNNLVGNAVKYTARGGILVGCRRQGERLRIEVWDTGRGIPAAERERVFGEFYQLDNPERDRSKGLGLGLAIVRRLADLLDHELTLRSRVGCGSVFAVSAPLAEGAAAEVPSAITPAGFSVRGTAVLVVDDETTVLDATGRLLGQWGCRVLLARDGEEAERVVREAGARVDLLLSDYRLAGEERGDAVVRRIRALVGRPLPAFLITGDTSEAVREAGEAVGCPVLPKPLAPAKLRTLIRNSVRASRSAAAGLA